jgi:hypothetical protein
MIMKRGVGMVGFAIFPVQYHPVMKKLEVFTEISFVVTGQEGFDYGKDILLSRHASESRILKVKKDVERMVVNPEDVEVIPFEWSEAEQNYVRCPK